MPTIRQHLDAIARARTAASPNSPVAFLGKPVGGDAERSRSAKENAFLGAATSARLANKVQEKLDPMTWRILVWRETSDGPFTWGGFKKWYSATFDQAPEAEWKKKLHAAVELGRIAWERVEFGRA